MNDQGENIVFLAREILNASAADSAPRKKTTKITMTFKTLCFTTILAASGGGLVTAWLHEGQRPLNRYEKTEIDALVMYAAKLKGVDQNSLRRDVEKQLGTKLDSMTASDFPAARRYLQEQAQ